MISRKLALEVYDEVQNIHQSGEKDTQTITTNVSIAAGIAIANIIDATRGVPETQVKQYVGTINETFPLDIQKTLQVVEAHRAWRGRVQAQVLPDAVSSSTGTYSDNLDLYCAMFKVSDFYDEETWNHMTANNGYIIDTIKKLEAVLSKLQTTAM